MTALTLECPKGVSMKTFFTTLLLLSSYSSLAATPSKSPKLDTTPQTEVIPKAAPGASTPALEQTKPEPKASAPAQKQEQSPGVVNDFAIGDYDKNGEYIFFDRLEREKKEAADEAAEQEQ